MTVNLLSLRIIQKLPFFIQKLQGIPVFRVVACGNDNTTLAIEVPDSNANSRRGGNACIDNVNAHCLQVGNHDIPNVGSGDPGIATYQNLYFFSRMPPF